MTPLQLVQKAFKHAIVKAFDSIDASDPKLFDVKLASNESFGHYQCNSPMRLTKLLQKAPREIAQTILDHLDTTLDNAPFISKTEIAGPGFINVHLSEQFFSQRLRHYLKDEHLGMERPKNPQRIIVEFSSPNVAKELHVAHLRSTIIGDTIARLFEFLGHDVMRLNHIGDWGTPFGMLIAYLKEFEPEILNGNKKAHLSELQDWYKASRKMFDEDEAFKKKAHLEVVKLQAKENESMNAWQLICDISRKAFETIYSLLDVKIQERGESFYEPYLPKIIETLEKKNLITISNGAKCVFMEPFSGKDNEPLPLIAQKADGGYNYATTDLAGFWHRSNKENADRIIIVTDGGQKLHFQMAFEAAKRAGLVHEKMQSFDHVTFGLVLGEDGKKIKTRSGETFRLIDLLEDAIVAAKEILLAREVDFSKDEIENTARILGIDAVKYADLSTLRTKDYTFSYDRMLRFEGNTAAFLLYAYVRSKSIQKKVDGALPDSSKLSAQHPSEISLAYHLSQFPDILNQIAADLYPNTLCDYLYTLAEKFNHFFRDCQVIGNEAQESRLLIVAAVSKIFEKGFQILGLEAIEKM